MFFPVTDTAEMIYPFKQKLPGFEWQCRCNVTEGLDLGERVTSQSKNLQTLFGALLGSGDSS